MTMTLERSLEISAALKKVIDFSDGICTNNEAGQKAIGFIGMYGREILSQLGSLATSGSPCAWMSESGLVVTPSEKYSMEDAYGTGNKYSIPMYSQPQPVARGEAVASGVWEEFGSEMWVSAKATQPLPRCPGMTQASVTDVQREAFEQWATSEFGYNMRRSLSDKDGYHYPSTQRAWEGWQAALSTQPKAVKASDLQELVDDWSDASYFSDVTPESVRDKHVHNLTAIIGEVD